MSYQNVSSPRFYIDYLSYSRAIGSGGNAVNLHEGEDWGDANLNNLIGLNSNFLMTLTFKKMRDVENKELNKLQELVDIERLKFIDKNNNKK